jgi:5-methyltetrahydropteroyltriglutamate--homocysteine methyltransferase
MGSSDRILTTHVGSLVRPPELVALLARQRDGEPVEESTLEAARKSAVADVVRTQAEIGIDIVSDGEFGKGISWSRYILERMSGFERRGAVSSEMPRAVHGTDRQRFAEFYAEYDKSQHFYGMDGWVVTGPITYTGQAAIRRDIEALKAAAAGLDIAGCFMPAVSPASVAPDRKHDYYRDADDSLAAICEALRAEYSAILDAGLILQIDDSYFATMYDFFHGDLERYRTWLGKQVELINHTIRGFPEERMRFHVCWGSWNGPHVGDAEMRHLVDLMLGIRVGGYSVEMANPRHEHEWRVWERVKLPDGKVLIPGVVSHATNVVEHPELVAERIERLARLVGRERVIASTDCGFAQGPFAQRVHPSIMWEKLRALVEGAALASGRLWGGAR